MVQWIVILAVLVCLSDTSLSRSWVGYDEHVDYESRLADLDDGPNWKSRYQGGGNSWENDESDEDYEDAGYRDYQPATNQGHPYHDSHTYHSQTHHQGHDQHGHNANCGHNHHQESRNHDNNYSTPSVHGYPSHNKGPAAWDPSHRDQESTRQPNHENGYNRYPGQPSEYPGPHGYPAQSGYAGHNPRSHGQASDTGSNGHHSQTGSVKLDVNSGSPRDFPPNNQPGSENDADRIVFPDLYNQATTTTRVPPTSSALPTVTTAATTPAGTTTTTHRSLLDIVVCVRACPATAEYNPVCGSNNVTYNNPGALQCARDCGLNITIARRAPCPRPTRLSSTVSPITNSPSPTSSERVQTTPFTTTPIPTPVTGKPTRFTNIDANLNKPPSTLIPLDVLQSLLRNATPSNSNTDGPESDIDKRIQP